MTPAREKALLPAGLRDVLPPEADQEARVVERLRGVFAQHGYARVKPPLVEFEDSLLFGAGASTAAETFRMMDPISQRMMGVRADMTMQIARIATTRLGKAARPLRLCYDGDVLRVKGKQLRPERQFTQVGAELIGATSAAADVEVIVMAIEALQTIGITKLAVDLSTPTLVRTLCKALKIEGDDEKRLRAALDRKDAAAVSRAAKATGNKDGEAIFAKLMAASGPAPKALAALAALQLPAEAKRETKRIAEVSNAVMQAVPDVHLTIDTVENRGFEYHTGVSFTLFRSGVRGELGSGGRYLASHVTGGQAPEPSTGFTLYLDVIMRALPERNERHNIYVPFGTPIEELRKLRDGGWATVGGLEPVRDLAGEAKRLGCSHLFKNGSVEALAEP
ncbi:MAG: ATP phosphoribosyltransferase regulatory subunit [Alphaproteobacteria bacterium]